MVVTLILIVVSIATPIYDTIAGGAYVAALLVAMYVPCRGSLWRSHQSVVS